VKYKKLKRGSVVQIEWEDSTTHCWGWQENAENNEAVIYTLGVVTHVTSKAVTLVQSVVVEGGGCGEVCNAMTIPKSAVRKINELDIRNG